MLGQKEERVTNTMWLVSRVAWYETRNENTTKGKQGITTAKKLNEMTSERKC